MSSLVHRKSKGCMELQLLRVSGLTHFHVSLCQFWNARSCPRNIQRTKVPLESKVLPFIAFDRTHTIYVVLSQAGLTMFRGYLWLMQGHCRLWPPSWSDWLTDWHTWPRFHPVIDPMPYKMKLEYLKLLYYRFFRSFRCNHVCSRWSAKKTRKSQL